MPIRILQIPYDSGHRAKRMGAGPLRLVDRGAVDRMRAIDADTALVPLEIAAAFPTEIGTAFELHRALSEAVAATARAGGLPLVLSGNCNSAIGTVSGLHAADPDVPLGVVWFDGHGDCNTPETFTGDFLDAMGLSTLTGRCWQALTATVPGWRAIPDEQVVMIGAHGADEAALGILAASSMAHVPAAAITGRDAETALGPALDALRARVPRVYIHLDVDVLDAAFAPANEWAPEGGLMPGHLAAAVEAIARRFTIAGAAVASYDPACDRNDRILGTALRFLELVAAVHRAAMLPNSPSRPQANRPF